MWKMSGTGERFSQIENKYLGCLRSHARLWNMPGRRNYLWENLQKTSEEHGNII